MYTLYNYVIFDYTPTYTCIHYILMLSGVRCLDMICIHVCTYPSKKYARTMIVSTRLHTYNK